MTASPFAGHDDVLLDRFPQLRSLVLAVDLDPVVSRSNLEHTDLVRAGGVQDWIAEQVSRAAVLDGTTLESSLAPIRAWRAVFAQLGLRPTQYRCAAESLLRRLRTRGQLPTVLPVVDVANAISVRFAMPLAVFDLGAVTGGLRVGPARGDERYDDFDGSTSHPAPEEVVYRDEDGQAHSRRWCWRQSATSVVSTETRRVLIVAEGVHAEAADDLADLHDELLTGLHLLGRPVLVVSDHAVASREEPATPPRSRPPATDCGGWAW